jgi:hypothetical protein
LTSRWRGLWTAPSIRDRSLPSSTEIPSWAGTGLSDAVVGSIEASIGSRFATSATLAMNSSMASFE